VIGHEVQTSHKVVPEKKNETLKVRTHTVTSSSELINVMKKSLSCKTNSLSACQGIQAF